LHQAAVQGQLRQKRNRGVGIDDSDDDSDVDDNERARRAMKRARRSERTDIKGLGRYFHLLEVLNIIHQHMFLESNKETRAFADSYNQSLRDDDEDFTFLDKECDVGDVLAVQTDDGDDNDDGENEETPVESVDVSEVHKAIQERAREGVRALTCLVPLALTFCPLAARRSRGRSERYLLVGRR
jgi:mediator of replication checkpoint protein 1